MKVLHKEYAEMSSLGALHGQSPQWHSLQLCCSAASYLGFTLGAETVWVHNPLGIFCFCAAWTHLGSAVTHVWPDSHALVRCLPSVCICPAFTPCVALAMSHTCEVAEQHAPPNCSVHIPLNTISAQEKLDHIGIVVLILGTPVTALMAHEHGSIPSDIKACFAAMLAAAFLPPAPRVAGFAAGIVAMVAMHFRTVMNANLAVQLALYATGGAAFLRWAPLAPLQSCTGAF